MDKDNKSNSNIRQPAVAGMFYPAEKNVLRSAVSEFLGKSKTSDIVPKAIVVPHAGYIYSGSIAAAGYKALYGKNFSNVVIVGPSHFSQFEGCALTPAEEWETPLGRVLINKSYFSGSQLIKELGSPHRKEHCIEVQLPFIQVILPKTLVVPVLTGSVDPYHLANELDSRLTENEILVISTDLSHYHPYREANQLDSLTTKSVVNLDPGGIAEACGATGLLSAMRLAKMRGWSAKLLAYANSGDTSGDKSSVVGYGCYAFF